MDLSKKEQELLEKEASLNLIFEILPKKMILLKEIASLDESIKDLKEEWNFGKKTKDPSKTDDILPLLKEAETIVCETILSDESNQKIIQKRQQQEKLEKKPKDIAQSRALHAKKAYGSQSL